MSFQDLSTELILEIVGHVAYVPPLITFTLQTDTRQRENGHLLYDQRAKCLSALMLCNRQFQFIVEPLLYSRILAWKLQQVILFKRTMTERAELARHVKELFLQESMATQIHGPPEEYTTGIGLSLRSDDSNPWDHVAVDTARILPPLFNLQSLCLERITGGNWSSFPTPFGMSDSRTDPWQSYAKAPEVPESLRHLTLSYKGDGRQRVSSGSISNFLKMKSATTLHLRQLKVTFGPHRNNIDYLPPGVAASYMKELRLSSCDMSTNSLNNLLSLTPNLERFSKIATGPAYLTSGNLHEMLVILDPARHALQQLILLSEYNDRQNRSLYDFQNIKEVKNSLDLFVGFPILTSLNVDAALVLATSETDANLKIAFLATTIQPWLRHLTLYQCDFVTYNHIGRLAEVKHKRGLELESITLQFHPDFPHWPTAIDPARSLVGAEVRENMAAQTKVIEKEYEELAKGQTFTSTPVSWSRPLPNPLVPIKERMARGLCEDSGISLTVQKFNPFVEMEGTKSIWSIWGR